MAFDTFISFTAFYVPANTTVQGNLSNTAFLNLALPSEVSLTRGQDDGAAAEATGLLGPRLRDGVKARRLKADSGRCCACIVTAKENISPVSAR
jgi:hypothetical protein